MDICAIIRAKMQFKDIHVIYALFAGILPALLWLWFWLREDNLHPEPRKIISFTFIAGAVSVLLAAGLEKVAQDYISDPTLKYTVWAAIEELVKIAAVYFVAFRSKYLDEPIDAMIYCVTVALGFAAFENVLFILYPLGSEPFLVSLVVGNLRFIGASLVHVVSTAAIGFMLGLFFYKKFIIKTIAAIFGLILAVALHASFNLAIINASATNALRVFGWVWLGAIILIILFEEVKAVKAET